MCREQGRHSTLDKGHEEGGSAYANAGLSLRIPPGYSRASTPQKNRVCLLYCFVHKESDMTERLNNNHLTPKATRDRTNTPKADRRKAIIKTRAEINKIETKETTEKINETKSPFFAQINKTYKPLARFIK